MIRQSTVAEVLLDDDFAALCAEYAAESAIDGLPPPVSRFAAYQALETAGLLTFFSATVDRHLVGFITVLVPPLTHYAEPVAVSESFFVAQSHRKSGAGLRLLRAAEHKAAELGSRTLLVSAPFGGRLAEVLPRVGYVESNRVFCKKVGHELISLSQSAIPAMSPTAIDKVRRLEDAARERPQVEMPTHHVLHGGLYARTIHIPAGVVITGALVRQATVLIVQGEVMAYIGNDEPMRLEGYNVLPASAGRKQVFLALTDTCMTMVLRSDARSVDEVEGEFTDETDALMSRHDLNHVVITGE